MEPWFYLIRLKSYPRLLQSHSILFLIKTKKRDRGGGCCLWNTLKYIISKTSKILYWATSKAFKGDSHMRGSGSCFWVCCILSLSTFLSINIPKFKSISNVLPNKLHLCFILTPSEILLSVKNSGFTWVQVSEKKSGCYWWHPSALSPARVPLSVTVTRV